MKETKKTDQNQEQKDKTPKWLIWTCILTAVGSCSAIIASVIGLFGDAPGRCIINNNYTENYIKRLDADFEDMVRRIELEENRINHGKNS